MIHVAKFELGAPQLNPLPPPLDVQMKLAIKRTRARQDAMGLGVARMEGGTERTYEPE